MQTDSKRSHEHGGRGTWPTFITCATCCSSHFKCICYRQTDRQTRVFAHPLTVEPYGGWHWITGSAVGTRSNTRCSTRPPTPLPLRPPSPLTSPLAWLKALFALLVKMATQFRLTKEREGEEEGAAGGRSSRFCVARATENSTALACTCHTQSVSH